MAKFHGVNINFGISSSLAGVTGQMQSRDHTYNSDNDMVRNGGGDVISKTFYNLKDECTFEYVSSAASGTAGLAAVTVPTVGDTITVTDSTQYSAIAGSTWLVDDVTTKGSNTSAVRVTLRLSRYPAISS